MDAIVKWNAVASRPVMRYKILLRNGNEWEEIAQFVAAPDRDSCIACLAKEWPHTVFVTPETLEYLKDRDKDKRGAGAVKQTHGTA